MESPAERRADDGEIRQVDGADEGGAWTIEVQRQQPAIGHENAANLVEGIGERRHIAETVAGGHDVNAGVGKRQRHHVADDEPRRRRAIASSPLRIRQLDHAGRDVEPDDRRTGTGGFEGDVAGSAREIEDAIVGVNPRLLDEQTLPGAVAPERQKPGNEVVAIGDGREQRPDVAPFLFR